jgi:uncharacterized protein involved in exopolysaccharide biosynthesis
MANDRMPLSLRSVSRDVWRDRRWVFAIVAASSLLSVVIALVSRPVYRAEAVVAPVGDDKSFGALGGMGSQLGGLASLAGVSIGKDDQWQQAVAILRSRHLIEQLVASENLIPILFPKKSAATFSIRLGAAAGPTMGDAVKSFRERVLQIREEPKTGLVTVRVEWFDPNLAAVWANRLTGLADQEIRERTISDASTALKALAHELDDAGSIELRTAISRLMESQLKAKMAAGIRRDYAFRIIDNAIPPDLDKRIQPTRTTMVLAGTLAGLIIALIAAVLRGDWQRGRSEG